MLILLFNYLFAGFDDEMCNDLPLWTVPVFECNYLQAVDFCLHVHWL